jgi:hypothetical protein
MTARLHLSNERQDIGRKLTRPGLEGFPHALYCANGVRRTQSRAARLGRR